MGLDMNLYGRKIPDFRDEDRMEDGFKIASVNLELGYWRKHPDLHGFIVDAFAEGKDECQQIELTEEDIHNIIVAINNDALAHGTTGFFFGKSYQPDESEYSYQKENDLKIFRDALEWLSNSDKKGYEYRSVYYQASW